MQVYNTVVTVIANLEADSPEAAIAKLSKSLERAGYEIYDDYHGDSQQAFVAAVTTKPDQLPHL